ncbi:MAG: spermidine synthase [Thermodesulfobacteriota bacterium]
MAQPWQVIDKADTDEGLLELRQRGEKDFLILIDDRVLMNSYANRSEIVLSELACQAISGRKNPRVLMGGLGMAFTLKAALDNLSDHATVTVAELNPVVVDWCRGPLAALTGKAVADPRVTVEIADVATVIAQAARQGGKAGFDAIILDLYEGPSESSRTRGEYEHLYGAAALALSSAALKPGGVFAVWSEDPDKAFEQRLSRAHFSFDQQRPGRGGRRHVVYIARKSGG